MYYIQYYNFFNTLTTARLLSILILTISSSYHCPYPYYSPYIVSIAWSVQRILSAFHSAMRGGIIFSRNILEYLSKMNYIHINHEETMLDEAVGYGLALVGLYFQLAYGFGLPFPLNILLLPFRMAEYFLIWIVNN